MIEDIKYRQIEQRLLRELMSPAYEVSDKLPSENALMKSFQVSKVTIRKALQRLEQDGILLCEHGKRRVLLRKPADTTKVRSGMSFGLFIQSEFLTKQDDLLGVAQGLTVGLQEWNAELALLPIHGAVSELEYVKRMIGRNMVDGLFIANLPEGAQIVEYLNSLHIPCVLLSNMDHNSPDPRQVPHIRLRERLVLNDYARQYRKIWLLGTRGDSLIRTRSLLDKDLPVQQCEVQLQTAEKIIRQRLEQLRDDELLLLGSMDLLRTLDSILAPSRRKKARSNVLVFRHSPTDVSYYHGGYMLFDRPMTALGEEAARQMRAVVLGQNSGINTPPETIVELDALIRPL